MRTASDPQTRSGARRYCRALAAAALALAVAAAAAAQGGGACAFGERSSGACFPSRAEMPEVPFLANQGQVDEDVAFYARTPRGTVFVTGDGAVVYSFSGKTEGGSGLSIAVKEVLVGATASPCGGRTIALPVCHVKGADSEQWTSGTTAHEVVELGHVYEGIRAALSYRGGNVEKLFVVEPGAAPDAIRIEVEGARELAVDRDGRMVLSTSLGDISFTRPVAYQMSEGRRTDVEVEYVVAGSSYGFTLGEYDDSLELTIDPLLASTYLGGTAGEGGYCGAAVAVGPDGTVYATGFTASDDFPTNYGDPYAGGAADVYVSRFDRTLSTLLTSVYMGGGNEEQASAIAVDDAGNVYVVGGTMSTDFPTTTGAHDQSYNGGAAGPYDVPGDVFVTKLSADLTSVIASTYFGGTSFDYARAVVIDGGSIFVTGATASNGLATAGAFDEIRNPGGELGGIDAYVASFDPSLTTLQAATYLGGGGADYCEDMVAGTSGGVYVTGWTSSDNYPFTPTAFDTIFEGGVYDAFVTGLDSSLASLTGSTYLGGTSWDFGYGMTIDGDGNVYVTGHNAELGAETTFPTTPGSFQTEYNGIGGPNVGDDAFVSKFDGSLSTLIASTEFGGTGWEYGTGMAWDPDGYVWVVGTTSSADIPRHLEAFQYDYAGDDASGHSGEGFVSRLTDDLTALDTSTFLGGSGNDWPECVTLDEDGNAYVTGSTTSQDFPTMYGSYEENWVGGDSDAFVSVLSPDLGAIGFTQSAEIGLPPLEVTLDGTAPTGFAPDSWSWDIDDDGDVDETGQSAVWTYDEPGLYSIRVLADYGPFAPSFVRVDGLLVLDQSSALMFDGTDSRAECPADDTINLTETITLEAWINPYDWGGFPFASMGFGQIMSKGPISLHLVGVHAQYNDNSLCLSLGHEGGGTSLSFTPVGSISLDEWQHVAATYDAGSSTVRMLVNGVEQTLTQTTAPTGNVADNATDDLLVGNIVTLNKGFEGTIDEVRVWNSVRAPDDITVCKDYALFGDEPGLVCYMRMNEAGGDVLTDGSLSGNTGTRVGAVWVQGVVLYATGVPDGQTDGEESSRILRANSPNPFGPATTIAFSLPEACTVSLAVYDVRGRLVKTLLEGNLEAGPRTAAWDGTDRRGGRVGSGVYFCRLSTPLGAETVKMVLTR